MRIRELYNTNILIPITNEENRFLKNNRGTIQIDTLTEREKRVAENLLYKDILCKISDNQLMVKEDEKHRH